MGLGWFLDFWYHPIGLYSETGTSGKLWIGPKRFDSMHYCMSCYSKHLGCFSHNGNKNCFVGIPLIEPSPYPLFKEQNTLLRALWACPRVTKSPRAVGPRAFGHPRVVLDKCIDKSFVLLWYNILHQFRIDDQTDHTFLCPGVNFQETSPLI